jgi:hypothetical protein
MSASDRERTATTTIIIITTTIIIADTDEAKKGIRADALFTPIPAGHAAALPRRERAPDNGAVTGGYCY